MRKMIFTMAAVLMLAIGATAQTTTHTDGPIGATTADGRQVILNADGTWAFAANDAKPKKLGVTKAGFAALKDGMSYREVVGILGGDGELLSETTLGDVRTAMYRWKPVNPGRVFQPSLDVMFQDDKLISKAQYNLK